jgi:membrane fusion protein (multidrug efflux system)
LERLQEEAQGSEAALEAAQAARKSMEHGQEREISAQKARLLGLQGDLERLEGAVESSRHRLQVLVHELELHRIRAPCAGRIGDLTLLRPGEEVERGDRIGTVIPDGGVVVVAFFDPAQAVGRVQPGQKATVRLHGFPWIQYGTLAAEVVGIASEATDGRVRAELLAPSRGPSAIPLQHGLPGEVEVEVERVSPFTLMVRAAGRRLIPVS